MGVIWLLVVLLVLLAVFGGVWVSNLLWLLVIVALVLLLVSLARGRG